MNVDELLPLVGQMARVAEEQAYAFMVAYEPTAEDLLTAIPDMVRVYCETAALLAADWYNSLDADSRYFATAMADISDDRLAATASWVYAGPQRPENRMRTAAHAMVFDAARNTIWGNASAEGVAVARHEGAGACEDCAVRATTVVIGSKDVSDTVPHDFHHSCTGMFVPVRSGAYEPPSYTREWGEKVAAARLAGNSTPEEIAKWLSAH